MSAVLEIYVRQPLCSPRDFLFSDSWLDGAVALGQYLGMRRALTASTACAPGALFDRPVSVDLEGDSRLMAQGMLVRQLIAMRRRMVWRSATTRRAT